MITLPVALVVLVAGLYFPIGIGAYWYGWRCADRFWKAQREEEIERGYQASYEQSTGDYPGNPPPMTWTIFYALACPLAFAMGWWRGMRHEENRAHRAKIRAYLARKARDDYRRAHPHISMRWGEREIDPRAISPQPIADYAMRGHHTALGMAPTKAEG